MSESTRPPEYDRHDQFHRLESLMLSYGEARAKRDSAGATLLMQEIHRQLTALIYKEDADV